MPNRATVPHLPVCHGLATTDHSSQQEAWTRACNTAHHLNVQSNVCQHHIQQSGLELLTNALHHGWLHKVADEHEPRIVAAAHRGEEAGHHGHISAGVLRASAHQGCEDFEVFLWGEGVCCGAILQPKTDVNAHHTHTSCRWAWNEGD